jgi:hypothetical protein
VTYIVAAEAVLKAAGRPLSTREVTELALKRGLINPAGSTPEATMSANLYAVVRDHPKGPIRREFVQGRERAVRNSVRWRWHGR